MKPGGRQCDAQSEAKAALRPTPWLPTVSSGSVPQYASTWAARPARGPVAAGLAVDPGRRRVAADHQQAAALAGVLLDGGQSVRGADTHIDRAVGPASPKLP